MKYSRCLICWTLINSKIKRLGNFFFVHLHICLNKKLAVRSYLSTYMYLTKNNRNQIQMFITHSEFFFKVKKIIKITKINEFFNFI